MMTNRDDKKNSILKMTGDELGPRPLKRNNQDNKEI